MSVHHGHMVAEKDGLTVLDCQGCGFAHLWPMPAAVDYQSAFYGDGAWFEKEALEQDYWLWEYRRRLRLWHRLTGRAEAGWLLDIGCGAGWFMREAVAQGWVAYGMEPAEQAQKWQEENGVQIIGREFPADYFGRGLFKWDFVHCKQVLEHVPDPVDFLAAVHGILADDGLLCIEVPQEFTTLQAALAAQHGHWYVCPHHVNYFTRASLIGLLKRCGFQVCFQEATFPMEVWALSGLYQYVGNSSQGLAAHWARMRFESALPDGVRESLRETLVWHDVGREVVVWARKLEV